MKAIVKHWVYIIYSAKAARYYIGQTKDIEKRLIRHNGGDVQSTRPYRPWKLVYSELHSTRGEAVLRERHLKSPAGWRELKRLKQPG